MNEIVGKIIIRAGIHAREKKEREKERRDICYRHHYLDE